MKSYLQKNMTHIALLRNRVPGSQLPDLLKLVADDHKEYIKAIERDRTKTEAAKELLVMKQANQQLERLFKRIDVEEKQANTLSQHYDQQIAKALAPAGTTDLLIRQQQLALVQNLKWTEVISLIRQGDKETVKCLELPLAKAKFNLHTNQNRIESLKMSGEQCLLGEEDYNALEKARAAGSAYQQFGDDLMTQHTMNGDLISKIEATIIKEVA